MKKAFIASALSLSIGLGTVALPASSFAAPVNVPISQGPISVAPTPSVSDKAGIEAQNLISNAIRKAIANGIRYGGPYLGNLLGKVSKPAGNWVTKNSGRVADFLDSLTTWQESAIASGFIAMGCPPDYAYALAAAIVALGSPI